MQTIGALPFDQAELRRVFGCYPSGVAALSALVGDQPVGMAVSSFTSVSIDPPLVSACMQANSATWPRLRDCGRLGVSVLAHGQDGICRSLSSKHGDRFAGVDWESSCNGAVFVHGATLWLDCSIYDELPAGDHTIALLEIHGARARHDHEPLVFHASRFRELAAVDASRPSKEA
ncbi:flavin reductase family protein [Rhodococcus koreensis]|uniref:flavin reductase family protein n=1 Tax=Rhodococcus koreensis TaxID=99653 RepID=UPI00366E7275